MFDQLAPLIAAGTISTPVAATYRFDQVKEAIAKAAQSAARCCSRRKRDSSASRSRVIYYESGPISPISQSNKLETTGDDDLHRRPHRPARRRRLQRFHEQGRQN
jgi:hypothetical protein